MTIYLSLSRLPAPRVCLVCYRRPVHTTTVYCTSRGKLHDFPTSRLPTVPMSAHQHHYFPAVTKQTVTRQPPHMAARQVAVHPFDSLHTPHRFYSHNLQCPSTYPPTTAQLKTPRCRQCCAMDCKRARGLKSTTHSVCVAFPSNSASDPFLRRHEIIQDML